MFNGGDVIDNDVNDDTTDDGFVDSISTENVIDYWVVGDDLADADIVEKGDAGGNAAAADTVDNDLAADDTIDG